MIDLAVVAIVKDEAAYLPEWLAFHEIVGVQHFCIYDNGSSDGTAEILRAHPRVTLVDWPGEAQQLNAYADALVRWKRRAHWLAFIDIDEFLYSPTYMPLTTVLRAFEEYPAVGVCWAMFGTNGWTTPPEPDVGTLRAYDHRADNATTRINSHVKSIVQPAGVRSNVILDPHHFDCDGVDELGRPLVGPWARTTTWERLKINHYVSRSEEEARLKLGRRRADTGELHTFDLLAPHLNACQDTDIQPYAPVLDRRLRA